MRWQTRTVFRFENGLISQLDAIGCIKNDKAVPKVKRAKKIDPEPNLEFGAIVKDRQIIITETIKLANEANSSEGWRAKNARHKQQKKQVFIAMLPVKHLSWTN